MSSPMYLHTLSVVLTEVRYTMCVMHVVPTHTRMYCILLHNFIMTIIVMDDFYYFFAVEIRSTTINVCDAPPSLIYCSDQCSEYCAYVCRTLVSHMRTDFQTQMYKKLMAIVAQLPDPRSKAINLS